MPGATTFRKPTSELLRLLAPMKRDVVEPVHAAPMHAAPIAPREIAVDDGPLKIPLTVGVDLQSAAAAVWPE
jgi:hypothetical protein